jgi:hypothetical protein
MAAEDGPLLISPVIYVGRASRRKLSGLTYEGPPLAIVS